MGGIQAGVRLARTVVELMLLTRAVTPPQQQTLAPSPLGCHHGQVKECLSKVTLPIPASFYHTLPTQAALTCCSPGQALAALTGAPGQAPPAKVPTSPPLRGLV